MKKVNLYMLLGIATIGSLHAMEWEENDPELKEAIRLSLLEAEENKLLNLALEHSMISYEKEQQIKKDAAYAAELSLQLNKKIVPDQAEETTPSSGERKKETVSHEQEKTKDYISTAQPLENSNSLKKAEELFEDAHPNDAEYLNKEINSDETPTEITSPNYNFTAPEWKDSENKHHLFKNVVLKRKYISDNSKPGIDNEPAIDLEALNKYHYRQQDYFENLINAYKLNAAHANDPELFQKLVAIHQKAIPFETALSDASQELHAQLVTYMAYGRDPNQELTRAQSFYNARGEFNKACFDILAFTKKTQEGNDGARSGDSLGGNSTQQNLNFNYNFVTNSAQETIEQQRRAEEQRKHNEEESRKRQEQSEQYQYALIDDLLHTIYHTSSSDNIILEKMQKIDRSYLKHALKSHNFPLSHLKDCLVHSEREKSIQYLNRECGTNIQLPRKQQAYRLNFNFA